jgi:hypothetical protein
MRNIVLLLTATSLGVSPVSAATEANTGSVRYVDTHAGVDAITTFNSLVGSNPFPSGVSQEVNQPHGVARLFARPGLVSLQAQIRNDNEVYVDPNANIYAFTLGSMRSSASQSIGFHVDAPVSRGFLEVAFPYLTTFTSNVETPAGTAGTIPYDALIPNAARYWANRDVSYVIDGWDPALQSWVGIEFGVFRSKNEAYDVGPLFFQGIKIPPNPRIVIQDGFESGAVLRIPFATGRFMQVSFGADCIGDIDQRPNTTTVANCDHSFGWGGILRATDISGSALPLSSLSFSRYDGGQLDFDLKTNLSGLPYEPIWPVDSSVPEPATWLSLILGLGLVGHALRRSQGFATKQDAKT